ncbi:cytokinin oxidase/dehydrogenase [Striga asiatica]|uniref:cytokinin dehydrogenase n=1 Tax=Striga asiatica TaxID=4170 RepID=A0A5A7R3V1_STRAF|nr:cytokinin oxidase/dehydrogenase [Striga asiatica]
MAIPQYYCNPLHMFVFLLSIIVIISVISAECKFRNDSSSIAIASSDYGNMVYETPTFVLYPSSDADIIDLVMATSSSSTIAARGHGHSVRGQALTSGGVVVNMTTLGENKTSDRIVIGWNESSGFYADVGTEQLWVDVLRATLKHGLAPISWTDYLYLSVGGTLSNAGIGGQAFLHGPQIVNVHQLQVITGKGENLTCSPNENPELFHAVLGGLGQFGIITKARIVLDKAPTNYRLCINLQARRAGNVDNPQMGSQQLSHPFLILFIQKSDIVKFNTLVLAGMLPRLNQSLGLFNLYPLNKMKWNDSMSAVTPDEDIFYGLGLLHSTPKDAYQSIDDFNNEILDVCKKWDIKIKQYLPHYTTQEDWINHFGLVKWDTFMKRKKLFDPKKILAPGQKIFN